jgi:hypothetical protein
VHLGLTTLAIEGDEAVADIWAATGNASAAEEWATTVSGTQLLQAGQQQQDKPQLPRLRGRAALRPIPAVEVDAAGCSFNPEPEAHQEALAAVVAAVVKKVGAGYSTLVSHGLSAGRQRFGGGGRGTSGVGLLRWG